MNAPTGFRIVDGEVTDVHPWAVMFNDRVFLQFAHMWVGAYMLVGFCVAGVYAVGMLRGRRDDHHRLGFMVPFVFAIVAALTPAVRRPRARRAASATGSRPSSRRSSWPRRPRARRRCGSAACSSTARSSGVDRHPVARLADRAELASTKPVPGLDTIPDDEHPPVNLTHWAFQTMVGIGTLLAAGVALFWFAALARPGPAGAAAGSCAFVRRRGPAGRGRARGRAGSPPRSAASRGSSTACMRTPEAAGDYTRPVVAARDHAPWSTPR